MRFAKPKLLFLSVLLGGILLTFPLFAAEEPSGTEQTKGDLGDIKTRLAALEAGQKEILAKEDKILEEVDRVRIWVHRK
ncbi:MAG: hypothetical protein PHV97_01050 [Candidatus Omnitrophica bacterium]|nr:hypothetical protein [Candidatus Omnitrophota bacterium]